MPKHETITQNQTTASIVIPVFNVEPYLTETLDSAIHQTYANIEIIVIDDGSTDGSGEICDEYARKDKRIRVIHQQNRGLSAARNAALDIATGDVVAFLDSDDAYHLEYIETMLSAMIQNGSDIVISRYTAYRCTGKMVNDDILDPIPAISPGEHNRIDTLQALADGTLNPNVWNKLYKKELWKTIRFPEGHVYEDVDTIHKIIDQCDKVYVLDDPLYMRRIRPDSITGICLQRNVEDYILAYSHFASFIDEHIPDVFSKAHLKQVRHTMMNRMISYYLWFSQNGDSDDVAFNKELREQIVSIGKKAGIGNCGVRRRLCYFMIRFCPRLLAAIYPAYRDIMY